jgi:hypothetical protein
MTVSMQIRAAAELELRRRTRQRKFINPNPIKWMQEHFIIPETGAAIQLEPYQKQAMREALKRTDGEHFDHSVIIWSDVKKSAKSTIAAAVALWYAFQVEWGQIVIVANDLKQADSRVGFYLRRAIELNPELAKLCKIIKYRVELPNHTFIEMVPIDPSGEAGGNADAVIYSELWGAHEEGKQRMWTETTLPPNKMGKAFRWVETYAGYSGESILLEQLYQQATRQGERIPDTIAPLYINRPARMFAMWNQQGRMPWHTQQYYAQEQAVLLDNEFQRIHENKWVTSEDIFVPLEWWDACRRTDLPPAVKDEALVLAADAGVSDDKFALAAVTRNLDDYSRTMVRYAHKWTAPPGGKIDFEGTEENPGPGREIDRLCELYNVLVFVYDAFQMEFKAQDIRNRNQIWCKAFAQTKDRLIADSMLRDMIKDQKILHSGEADLREHIGNANAQVDAEERKIRIIKRSPLLKIDLAVALSMANAEAMRLNL